MVMFENKLLSYKLVGKTPVKCSLEESFDFERTIRKDVFDDILVSTVFLAFDHSFNFQSKSSNPVLFETLVFGGKHDGYMLRYQTYDEAVNGHEEVCYMINKVSIDRGNKLDDLGI